MAQGKLRSIAFTLSIAGAAVLAGTPAGAGGHTWVINEVFSNADGTVQFIESRECCGGAGETATAGHTVSSNTNTSIPIPFNSSMTAFRHILFGTVAYDALPNSPTPDIFIPPNFFSISGDTITYSGLHSAPFGPGTLPTNGTQSLNRDGGGPFTGNLVVVATNSPTNHAGVSGSVNAAPPGPPAVPDGTTGTPMRATKLDAAGSSLSVSWDASLCSGTANHQIIHGTKAQLPAAPGGTFGVSGSACGLGASSPYAWNPSPAPGSGELTWWLMLVTDGGTVEGSWGQGSDNLERKGPGANNSSGQCGITNKNASNTCGQ